MIYCIKLIGGLNLSVNYNKLWKLLIDKGMSKTEMRKKAGISTNILAKLGRNEMVSMETLCKIINVLQCGVDDIVEFTSMNGEKSNDAN